jgi:hypothetical protein
MIGGFKFVSFYGNDIIPVTAYQSYISQNQNDLTATKVTNSSVYSNITTDKIPVGITFSLNTSLDFSLSAFADIKESNDTTEAITQINSGTIINVPQEKRLTISMKSSTLIATSDGNGYFTLRNLLTNEIISSFSLNLYNSGIGEA